MKKKLSLLLALVMILSLVPMSAFAASTNSVDRVPKVDKNMKYSDGDTNAPVLFVEESDTTVFDNVYGEEFYLELENAEWNFTGSVSVTSPTGNAGATGTMYYETETSARVVLKGDTAQTRGNDAFDIPMIIDVDGEGEVKVTIDRRDSRVSTGTYTIAVVGDGATVATVEKAKTLAHRDSGTLARIKIDETSIKAVSGDQEFELELPDGFEWDSAATTVTGFEGEAVSKTLSSDKETLTIKLTNVPENKRVRRMMTIVPVVIATKDAEYGEILVDIDVNEGQISDARNLLIGNYADYSYTVSVDEDYDDVIIAGKIDKNFVSAEVTIKEKITDSLWEGKNIEVELPDGVEIAKGFTVTSKVGSDTQFADANIVGESEFEFSVPKRPANNTTKHEFTFEIPLVASVDFEGDVEITITGDAIGRGQEEVVVVAEVVKPIEVEIEPVDVVIGTQNQSAPNIIIKENVKEALKEGKNLVFDLDSVFGGMNFVDADIEVIDGNLEIDKAKSGVGVKGYGDNELVIHVKKDSKDPSTIEISNVKVSLNRNVPVGPFDVAVKGDAIIDYVNANGDYIDVLGVTEAFDDLESAILEVEFVNVVTSIDLVQRRSAQFVIDSLEYVVDGKVLTTDAAPYIDAAAGRTMLPIRVFANALGVSDDSILWNQAEQSVTIFKGDRVIKVVMGQMSYSVNGVTVPMDAAAVNKDGRTFLPLRSLAQALGAEITWDEATRTVGVNQ